MEEIISKSDRFPPHLGVTVLARNLADDPVQPKLKTYSKKNFDSKQRGFSKYWFAGRPWLKYSQIADYAFFCCFRAFPYSKSQIRLLHGLRIGVFKLEISNEQRQIAESTRNVGSFLEFCQKSM